MTEIDLENVESDFLAFSWENLPPWDRAIIMADSAKTLWIFGAGASHHYDLNLHRVPVPLANGFFNAFHALPTSWGLQAHVGPFISFLLGSRGVKVSELLDWTENIEDFMTSIESDLNDLRIKKEREQLDANDMEKLFSLAPVFNNMNFIFANVLNEAQNGPSYSLYHDLLQVCGPNDTFISFNWDTLLDRALADSGGWTPNDGYGLSFSSVLDGTWKPGVESSPRFSTKWKLLKLHGSTNWLVPYIGVHLETLEFKPVFRTNEIFLYWQSTLPYETFKGRWRGGYAPTCYCYYPPNLPVAFFPSEQLSLRDGRIALSVSLIRIFAPFEEPTVQGVPSSPLLITPLRQKKYDLFQSSIESLWQQASENIRTAERIVVIGYSFPLTDTRVLALIRDALESRKGEIAVELVSPSAEDIATRIGKDHLAKAKNLIIRPMKFEDYLRVIWKDLPQLMKNG